jgi:hypothetical protein
VGNEYQLVNFELINAPPGNLANDYKSGVRWQKYEVIMSSRSVVEQNSNTLTWKWDGTVRASMDMDAFCKAESGQDNWLYADCNDDIQWSNSAASYGWGIGYGACTNSCKSYHPLVACMDEDGGSNDAGILYLYYPTLTFGGLKEETKVPLGSYNCPWSSDQCNKCGGADWNVYTQAPSYSGRKT